MGGATADWSRGCEGEAKRGRGREGEGKETERGRDRERGAATASEAERTPGGPIRQKAKRKPRRRKEVK